MIEQAFGWIGRLVEWVGQWFPRWVIVPPYRAGVKFPRGRNQVPFGPGILWYWPATTVYLTCTTVRTVLSLTPQRLTTRDGVAVEVAGVLAYRVTNPTRFLMDSYDAEHVLDDAALAGVRKIVVRRDYADLLSGQADLDESLTKAVKRLVEEDFGVEVLYVRLTDFVKTRVLSLSGNIADLSPNQQ